MRFFASPLALLCILSFAAQLCWAGPLEDADAHLKAGRAKEAEAAYSQALAAKADDVAALLGRGRARHKLNDIAGATADFDRAAKVAPKSTEVWLRRAMFHEATSDDGRAALADYNEIVKLAPKSAQAYTLRADFLLKVNLAKEALVDAEKAIAIKPDLAQGHALHGYALEKLALKDSAAKSYKKALQLDPNNALAQKGVQTLFLFEAPLRADGSIRIDRTQIPVDESAQITLDDVNAIDTPRWEADPVGIVQFLDVRVMDGKPMVTVKALAPGRVTVNGRILDSTYTVGLTVTGESSSGGSEEVGRVKLEGLLRTLEMTGLQAELARMLYEVNMGQRSPKSFFEEVKRAGGSVEDVTSVRDRLSGAWGRTDPTVAIALMLYEVRMGRRTPEAFYRDLGKLVVTKPDGTRASGTMFDVIRTRSMLVDFPDPWLRNSVLGQTYEAGSTKVEKVILLGRRDQTLAAIDEVVKKFVKAGRVPAEGCSLIISHVGKWANQANDSLTFTGDIDFSFVSNDEKLALDMRDEFVREIERLTGLDPKSLDSVATAHGKAGLEVYIGAWGMAFAEEQMKINERVDMTDGSRTKLDLPEVADLLTQERSLAEAAGNPLPEPAKGNETEPGLSMEMVRHFGHDIVDSKIFDVTNAVVKAAKYLDRSFQSFEKTGGVHTDARQAELAAFAKRITELANTKPQTLKVREDMVKLISEYLDAKPRTVWDGGTKTLKLTLDAAKVRAFHEKATRAMWETVKQGSKKRTEDVDARLRELQQRQGKGEDVDLEIATLREDMVKLRDMVEAEIKAFGPKAGIPIEVHTNNAKVLELLNRMSQRFGVKALSLEELKEKRFVEELLKAEAQHASEQRRRQLTAYVMDRALRAAELPMQGVEKVNSILDIVDDRLMGPLRGDPDFVQMETTLKAIRETKVGAVAEGHLSTLRGHVSSKIKATNKYLNESLQKTAAGRGSMKLLMVYGVVDEMIAYRNAFCDGGWGEFATEVLRRRVPFTSSIEAGIMGNNLRAGWDVITTLVPPAALPEAAFGLGRGIGDLVVSTYWSEQLALFVDTLYKDATFSLDATEQYEGAKVGVFRLVEVKYPGSEPIKLAKFAAMRKAQVEALRQQIGRGRLDWGAYTRECDGLTSWMEVDTVLKKNLAASDPALVLLDTMCQDINVGPKLMDRLAEKGVVRWEEVKLGFITNMIKRLEDRKQADDALGRGMLPDLFQELRKIAVELEIEEAMLRGLDAEADTNNLKKLINWLWDTKRSTLGQAPVESETTRTAQVVKKYLDSYKAILTARNEMAASLGDTAGRDGKTRYLTGELFLSGRAETDAGAAQVWVQQVPATRSATAAALLEIKRGFLPGATLDSEDDKFQDRLFVPELWIKPYREAGKDPKKQAVLARGVDHAKTRNAILEEYRIWLKKQAPVELTVTLVDAKEAKRVVKEASGDLRPLDDLGRPGTGRAAGVTLVFGVPSGRYRLTVRASGYADVSQDLTLGRALNPTPKVTVSLEPTGSGDTRLDPKLAAELESAIQARNWKQMADLLDTQNRSTPKNLSHIEAITKALDTLKDQYLTWIQAGPDYLRTLGRVDTLAWDKLAGEVQRRRMDMEARGVKESTPQETPSQRAARCRQEGQAFEDRCLGTLPTQHREEQQRIALGLQELPKAVLALPGTATHRVWFEAVVQLAETFKLPFPYPDPVVPRLNYISTFPDQDPAAKKKEAPSVLKVTIEAPQATVPFGKPITLNASASGGKAPYTYVWSSGGSGSRVTLTPTYAGEWTLVVTATDALGSTGEGSATLRVAPEKTKLVGIVSKVTYGGRASLSVPIPKPETPEKTAGSVDTDTPETYAHLRQSNFITIFFNGSYTLNTPDGEKTFSTRPGGYGKWGVPISWTGDEFFYSGPTPGYRPENSTWEQLPGAYRLWGKVSPDGTAIQSLRLILQRENDSMVAFELRDLELKRGADNFAPWMTWLYYVEINVLHADSAGLFHMMVKIKDKESVARGAAELVEFRPFGYSIAIFRSPDLPTASSGSAGSLDDVRRKTNDYFQTGGNWARLSPITDERLMALWPDQVNRRLTGSLLEIQTDPAGEKGLLADGRDAITVKARVKPKTGQPTAAHQAATKGIVFSGEGDGVNWLVFGKAEPELVEGWKVVHVKASTPDSIRPGEAKLPATFTVRAVAQDKGKPLMQQIKIAVAASPEIARRRYVWQSTPGLTFAPATSEDGRTQVTYDRMGPVKIWCETQEEVNGVFHTVGEADQATTNVVAPGFTVAFTPAEGQGRMGQEVRATVTATPAVADAILDFRWSDPPSSNRTDRTDNAREIVFKLKDAKPVVLKAMARVPSYGDEIATVSAAYTGVMYELRAFAEEPGNRPQVWDPTKKGLVPVPKGQYVVHERIPLVARFEGASPADVRWAWTVNEGTTLSNPTSRTPTVSRSSAGSIEAKVVALDADNVLLGSADLNLSVIEATGKLASAQLTPKVLPNAGTLTQDNSRPRVDPAQAQTQSEGLVKEGIAHFDQKRYAEAVAALDKAIALTPSDPEAYRRRAMSKRELQDYAGAIADFTKALELDPRNSRTYAGRGVTKTKSGDVSGAMQDFTRAIELDPQYENAFLDRCDLRLKQKDFTGALADADRAIALNPKRGIAYNNRGAAKELLKDLQGALEDYQKAVDLDPTNEKAKKNLARVKAALAQKTK